MIVITFLVALVAAAVVRGPSVFLGLLIAAVLFVPLERRFALRPQPTFRRGIVTDLTHLLLNAMVVAVLTVAFLVVAALPWLWLRAVDVEAVLPGWLTIPLAVTLVLVGQYWGHRLTHEVPFLWRFHAVHHSIEQMDWVAAGRLHPVDQAFTQAFTVLPLFLLGYGQFAVAGVGVAVGLLALFQHANVRLRFPVIRWIVNTPEWHHWHHAIDPEARDRNFGLPAVDLLFGTAYLPAEARPNGFGTTDPVPPTGYLRQLAAPFAPRRRASSGAATSDREGGPLVLDVGA